MISRKTFSAVAIVLLAGAICAVYGQTLNSPFVFDDAASVVRNSSITRLWPMVGDADHPGPLATSKNVPTSGRPLVNLSLAVNYFFGQLNPVGYHIFNLIVHLLSALLLMAIVRRTLRLEYFGGRFERASGALAFATALLWAVHPLQTETVVYVTQRTELMVGFFYLATLYASLRYWAAASSSSRTTWLALATLACLAGMACKEVMVTAPAIVLLFERTFISGSFRRALANSWPLYVGLFASWGLLVYLNYGAPRSDTAGFHLGISACAWWLTQTKVLLMYLKLAFWPWPLSIHYEMPHLTTLGAAWPWLAPVALLGIVTLVLLWRKSAIGFVGAWIFVILSPTLIVPITTEVAAERRMYLPLAALASLVIVGGYWLAQRTSQRSSNSRAVREPSGSWPMVLAAASALVCAVVLCAVSIARLKVYHDELTLWQDALVAQPDDPIAHYNFGNELVRAGRVREALVQYQEYVRRNPNLPEAHNNLGNALAESGRFREAIEQYQQAMQLKPDYPEAHENLGLALVRMGQPQQAIQYFAEAVRLKPDFFEAQNNWGDALINTNQPQQAIEHLQEALRLNPDFAEAHNTLGTALVKLGRVPEAIEHYQRALQLQPTLAEAHYNLGNLFAKAGRASEAAEHFQRALQINPDYAQAHNNLGNVLADSGRPEEAIDHYLQALRVNPQNVSTYANLAKTYVALHRDAEAIASAQKALAVAQANGDTNMTQQIEAWLTEYRASHANPRDAPAPMDASGDRPPK